MLCVPVHKHNKYESFVNTKLDTIKLSIWCVGTFPHFLYDFFFFGVGDSTQTQCPPKPKPVLYGNFRDMMYIAHIVNDIHQKQTNQPIRLIYYKHSYTLLKQSKSL